MKINENPKVIKMRASIRALEDKLDIARLDKNIKKARLIRTEQENIKRELNSYIIHLMNEGWD